MSRHPPSANPTQPDKQQRILDAVLTLLTDGGISAVSIRAVAREAGVALGLVSYYYADKTSLIKAALKQIEEHDIAMVEPDLARPPTERLRNALTRFADQEFLSTEYLTLRLQLWALAQADPEYADINAAAQKRYRSGLSSLIRSARPDLTRAEANKRATDIDIIQNGIWLTWLLGLDKAAVRRSITRCEAIALEG